MTQTVAFCVVTWPVSGKERRKIRFQDDDRHNPDEPEKDSRSKYKLAAKLMTSYSVADDIPLPPGLEECKHCLAPISLQIFRQSPASVYGFDRIICPFQ